jgi:hypothetical protein
MAIQIAGTTVIGDLRSLENIASIDTDTAASIRASVNRAYYEVFDTSRDWTKPSGISPDATVIVEAWGGGGGGGCERGTASSTGGGGGGGGYTMRRFRLGDLPSTVAVGVGAGGTGGGANGSGGAGSNSTFGAFLTAPAGAGGSYSISNVSVGNALGGLLGFPGSEYFSGGSGSDGEGAGRRAYMGGGGGGGANAARAENSYAGGTSVGGGNGGNGVRGNPAVAGSVPGGGGGGSADQGGVGAAGARGEVRVWVLG